MDYLKKDETDIRERIFIIEEPENNMYPLLQKKLTQAIYELKLSQIICTTHSPYIIDLRKTKQIVKIVSSLTGSKHFTLNIDGNDFASIGNNVFVELSEMFFYDFVLLVEGWTEKYFYSQLERDNKDFLGFLYKKNAGIFCIYGIGFHKIKSILNDLGIEIVIKTDNDIYHIGKKEKNIKTYAGITRVIDCLDESEITQIKEMLNFTDNKDIKKAFRFNCANGERVNKNIEDNMDTIINIFENKNIIISKSHEGFEGDVYDFIFSNENPINLEKRNEFIKRMKKEKLKNLHSYITKNNIKLEINDSNKRNCLVKFLENF
ncbi:MAG: ATP-dependent nuclease [Metamycoplasmataceae bacterium]